MRASHGRCGIPQDEGRLHTDRSLSLRTSSLSIRTLPDLTMKRWRLTSPSSSITSFFLKETTCATDLIFSQSSGVIFAACTPIRNAPPSRCIVVIIVEFVANSQSRYFVFESLKSPSAEFSDPQSCDRLLQFPYQSETWYCGTYYRQIVFLRMWNIAWYGDVIG